MIPIAMSDAAAATPSGLARLIWSNLAAQSAEQIAVAAAAIVAVVALGAGEGQTGLLHTALTLPFLLCAIPAGILADRMSRSRLMAGAELLRAAALATILVLVQTSLVTWPALAALGFVAACGTVVFSVAAPSLVPSLVGSDGLATANARIELARTVAFAAGPAVGGSLVGWTGAGFAFGLAAALSLLAALLLRDLREPRPAQAPDRHPLRDATEGIAFVAAHAMLRPVFVTQFVFGAAYFVILAVYVPYAFRHLGLSAAGIGLTLGLYGGGMVVGALLAPALMRRLRFGLVVGIGPVAGLIASVIMALTIWMPTAVLAGLSFFLFGAGPILWVISTATLRQAVTPPGLLGRVSSVNILAYSARPVGAALGALIGGIFGAETCLVVAVAGFLTQALVIWRSPAVALERQP